MSVLTSVSGASRAVLRPMVRLAREVPVWAALGRPRQGRGPLIVFLPSAPPRGAALLRIYRMAEVLGVLGWRTLVLPPRLTLMQRKRVLWAAGPDVLVMQGARHALNRPRLYPDIPILYDMDDADFHLPHLAPAVQNAMREVAGVIAGSRYIADWALQQGAPRAQVVWTGTDPSPPPPPQHGRPPVVAWAQTRPMTYTREADLVRRVMAEVARRNPGMTLRLYDCQPGDDASFADSFCQPGLVVEWRKTSEYSDYLKSFDDVAVGLAPLCPQTPFSRGKSFGKVLAYLDRGVPVVASDAGEHAAFFSAETGVISNDAPIWRDQICNLLAAAPDRQAMVTRARAGFLQRLTTETAAQQLHDELMVVLTERSRASCQVASAGVSLGN